MSKLIERGSWPPASSTVDRPVDHGEARGPESWRGVEIDAQTNERGEWIAFVAGDEVDGHERSRADAIRRARSSVNRRLGKVETRRSVVGDGDGWVEAMREAIR